MRKLVVEGKGRIRVSVGQITRKMHVFYNPAMKLNRDISVLLLKSIKKNNLKVADPLAASGIRSIRFLSELSKNKIDSIFVNDGSKYSYKNIKQNLKLNKINNRRITLKNEEANSFLLQNKPFDYIDIDPFGTPVYFLDSAVKSLARNGILAVTATDTAALSGTAPKACLRKYWATPLKNFMMHELGLRILIRRIQLTAASYDKALTPIYSYSKLHYMRVFMVNSGRIKDVDNLLKKHLFVSYCHTCLSTKLISNIQVRPCDYCKKSKISFAGPLWAGDLWDSGIANLIWKHNINESNSKFLKIIADESKIHSFGFYDTHYIARSLKITVPRLESVIRKLKVRNFIVARTHVSAASLRSDVDHQTFLEVTKSK